MAKALERHEEFIGILFIKLIEIKRRRR